MAIAFITGSGRRIGKGLAIEFARKNWDVIIHYNNSAESARNTLKEVRDLGAKAVMFQADIRDIKSVKTGFEKAVNELGYPDVLVNNAAIYPSAHSLNETEDSLWDEVMDTNLKSYFQVSKLFYENAGKGSRIINIASLGAFGIWKGRIPYNVSKAGVIQLTKALAKNLAPDIAVNSVSPGSIEIVNEPTVGGPALNIDKIPMQRYGSIKDVFDAVYFFATSSLYITGQNINVDGGYHL